MNKRANYRSSPKSATYPDRRMVLQLRRRHAQTDNNDHDHGEAASSVSPAQQVSQNRSESSLTLSGTINWIEDEENDDEDDDSSSSSDSSNYFKTVLQDAVGRDSSSKYEYLFEPKRHRRRQHDNDGHGNRGDEEEDNDDLEEALSSSSSSSIDSLVVESEDENSDQVRSIASSSSRHAKSATKLARRTPHETMKPKVTPTKTTSRRHEPQKQRRVQPRSDIVSTPQASASRYGGTPTTTPTAPHLVSSSLSSPSYKIGASDPHGRTEGQHASSDDDWNQRVQVISQKQDTGIVAPVHRHRKQRKHVVEGDDLQTRSRPASEPQKVTVRPTLREASSPSKQRPLYQDSSPTSTMTASTAATSTATFPSSHQHQLQHLAQSHDTILPNGIANTVQLWSSLVSSSAKMGDQGESTGASAGRSSDESRAVVDARTSTPDHRQKQQQLAIQRQELSNWKRDYQQDQPNFQTRLDQVASGDTGSMKVSSSKQQEQPQPLPLPPSIAPPLATSASSTPSEISRVDSTVTTSVPAPLPALSEHMRRNEQERLQLLLDYEIDRRLKSEAHRAALKLEVEDLKRHFAEHSTDKKTRRAVPTPSDATETRQQNGAPAESDSGKTLLSPRRNMMQQVTQAFDGNAELGSGSRDTSQSGKDSNDATNPTQTRESSSVNGPIAGSQIVRVDSTTTAESQSRVKKSHTSLEELYRQERARSRELASDLEALEVKYSSDWQQWKTQTKQMHEQFEERVETSVQENRSRFQSQLDQLQQRCTDVESQKEELKSKLREAEAMHSQNFRQRQETLESLMPKRDSHQLEALEAQSAQEMASWQAQQDLALKAEAERDNLRAQMQTMEAQHEQETKELRLQVKQAMVARDEHKLQLRTIKESHSRELRLFQMQVDQAVSERDEIRTQLDHHVSQELDVLESAAAERDKLKEYIQTLKTQHAEERVKWQTMRHSETSKRDDPASNVERLDANVEGETPSEHFNDESHDGNHKHRHEKSDDGRLAAELRSLQQEHRKEKAGWEANLKLATEQRAQAQTELLTLQGKYEQLAQDFRDMKKTHQTDNEEWQSLLEASLAGESPTDEKSQSVHDFPRSSDIRVLQGRIVWLEQQLDELKAKHANEQSDWHQHLQELMGTDPKDIEVASEIDEMQNENKQLHSTEWKLQVERKRTDLLEKHCKSMEVKHSQEIAEWKEQLDVQVKRYQREEDKCKQLSEHVSNLQKQLDLLLWTEPNADDNDLLSFSNDVDILQDNLKALAAESPSELVEMDNKLSPPELNELEFDLDALITEIKEDCRDCSTLLQEIGEGNNHPNVTDTFNGGSDEGNRTMRPEQNDASFPFPDPDTVVPQSCCCSPLIDQTISLVRKLTGTGNATEEEKSEVDQEALVDQLEKLSVKMKEHEMTIENLNLTIADVAGLLPVAHTPDRSFQNQELALALPEVEESHISLGGSSIPWMDWVRELQQKCDFLEKDRLEVARLANDMVDMERETHRIQVNAAVATAKREAAEDLLMHKQQTQIHFQHLFHGLCEKCQDRILYGAAEAAA